MIDRGEISDTCVWARDGQVNVLLSTSTKEYKEAVENTKVSEMSASWKDVKIGNKILLKNNISGIWLGKMFLTGISYYYNNSNANKIKVSEKSIHIIYINTDNKKKLLVINNPKLASILSDETMLDSDAEILANNLLNDKKCSVEYNGYSNFFALTIGAPKFGKNTTLSLESVSVDTQDQLDELINNYNERGSIYTKSSKSLYKIEKNRDYSIHKSMKVEYVCKHFCLDSFNNNEIIPLYDSVTNRNTYNWGKNNTYLEERKHDYFFNNKDEFYHMVVKFDTKSGNKLKAYV
jgi:hypothetical protein